MTIAIVALGTAFLAAGLAAWAFLTACDALHKPGRQGPRGPQGFQGAQGSPGECRCWQEDGEEHDRPKPESDGEIKGRWGWPE